MQDIIIYLLYLFRPLSYATLNVGIGSLSFFEIFGGFSLLAIVFVYLLNLGDARARRVNAIDIVVMMYVFWCVGIYIAYIDRSHIQDLLKFTIPLLTYIVVRNTIKSPQQYLKLIWVMIVAYSVPIVLSAIFVLLHKGVYVQNYWTGLYRYTGTFPNPHDFGHSMALYFYICAIYVTLLKVKFNISVSTAKKYFMLAVGIFALFCLYKSYVRTAFVGLVIFTFIYFYFYNKKVLIVGGGVLVLAVVASWSVWTLIFHDVVDVAKGDRDADRIASGRPFIWKHNLDEFSKLTFDRKLAGVGLGNRSNVLTTHGKENFWNSHNDYLEIMIQTGIIGLLIFVLLQLLIIRAIFRLPKQERNVFLAFYFAVFCMNFASNSYIDRFGLAQTFYMLLAYIEIRNNETVGRNKLDNNNSNGNDNGNGNGVLYKRV